MKTQKRKIIIIFICLGGGLLLARFIYLKMNRHLTDLDSQIAKLDTDLQLARNEIEHNQDFVDKWAKISSFQDEQTDERGTKLTAYLDSLVAELDIVYQEISAPNAQQLKENQEFQILSYKVVFTAYLEDLVELLDRLNTSDRLIRIDQLQITRRKTAYAGYYETPLPSTKELTVEIIISTPTAIPKNDTMTETTIS